MNGLPPSDADDAAVAVYELSPDGLDAPPPEEDDQQARRNHSLLLRNARWFCRLRWIVAGFLLTAALMAHFPAWTNWFEVRWLPSWLLVSAAVLAVANGLHLFLLNRLSSDAASRRLRVHLWCQIAVDLVVLTAVVHSLGSYVTYAPVAYLFHIVLACIFFARWESLGVTVLSGVLFAALVLLETAEVLQGPPALLEASAVAGYGRAAWMRQLVSLLGIWTVIWYLTSRLATDLRHRERELAAANRRLEASSIERASHMLQTTHQLKAPFAAIHANTQLLLKGYVGPLSDPARGVIEKIASRAQMLSQQIQQMLQLANLRSQSQTRPELVVLELSGVIRREVERIEPQAALRRISLETDLQPVLVHATDDYLTMLIDNLLNNAVNYSLDGGCVSVACGRSGRTCACMTVRDRGIGIPADRLPRVFEDYYRTTSAARHHKASTGLGLAIVRLVAAILQATVRIESSPGWGTRVTLRMPAVSDDVPFESPGDSHGLLVDRR
jgi:two-component system, OmpR family, phosphate regulon sensor histidine kinase PhoR